MNKNLLSLVIVLILITKISAFPLSGNYTINSALPTGINNFQSFTAFADSINLNGVAGDVTVTVEPGSGPYHEQVVLADIPGTGPTATVTLDGNYETLVAVTNTTDRHALRLTNLQYFTVTRLHIQRDSSSTSGFYGVHIFNTGNNISITNCSVDLTSTISTLSGAYVASGSETSILDSGDFHNITIANDTAVGGGYGASVFGLGSNLASKIVITDNVFLDFNDNGVYLRETDSAVVRNNFFDKRTSQVTSCNAIQVAQASNLNTQIYNNHITVSQTVNNSMSMRGIYLFNGTGHKVYNNVIYDIHLTAGNYTGIEVRSAGTAPEIYFNTISIDHADSTTGDLFGISEELSNTNSFIRNNLISISQPTSGLKAAFALGATAAPVTAFNSDNNILYVPGGNTAVKNSLTPDLYITLTDWQVISSQDTNSFDVDPGLVSLTSPIPSNPNTDNEGVNIPWITQDVAGVVRNDPPDIGAYEYFPVSVSENIHQYDFNMYPNPVVNKLNINFNEGLKGSKINIISLTGKKAIQKLLSTTVNKTTVDVSSLPSGIYFLTIDTEKNIYSEKFIKQ